MIIGQSQSVRLRRAIGSSLSCGIFADRRHASTDAPTTSAVSRSGRNRACRGRRRLAARGEPQQNGYGDKQTLTRANHCDLAGSEPGAERVIGTGETLDGSTITDLRFCDDGLNESGQLALQAPFNAVSTISLIARLSRIVGCPGTLCSVSDAGVATPPAQAGMRELCLCDQITLVSGRLPIWRATSGGSGAVMVNVN